MKNKFITIEGLESSGKTTACDIIVKTLNEYGIHNENIIITREPGGTPVGESLRNIIKDRNNEHISYKTELLIMYAARVELIENVIKPALNIGQWVISDRHDLSSQAYQGGGRCLGLKMINKLRGMILGSFYPDLTFYLDITADICLKRLQIKGKLDRIEQESLHFFERTRNYYLKIIKQDNSIVLIDATQSLDKVRENLKNFLFDWLKKQ
ncbi:dTMP kinase [Candidatus Pantoea edessiphila]|uniref:Thymidylate kinase n=1 Tax=Candidatus Pantoea edessiphila TaxID=2044610 RepID=A0A2P5SYV2_9GAMM|nr:dTMP kinase [Candidatus Pantoea edessiphila]MBK4775353.1 dTMP kinase [Pantoea sp. Edef]PPI87514.1 dTMP kinase [Candidatus Pantoea edessiphila]